MLTLEVEMAAVTRDAGGTPAETTELSRTEMVMLALGLGAWAVLGLSLIIMLFVG
jgi:hypothetical protein